MKILTVTASIALALSLAACGSDDPGQEASAPSASDSNTPGDDASTEAAPETVEPTEPGGSAPTEVDPEVAPFCEAFVSILEVVPDQGASEAEQAATLVEGLRTWVAGMEPALPADIPEDAQRGFDVVSDQVDSLEDDATLEDVNSVDQDLSAQDEDAATAFTEYAAGLCPAPAPPGTTTPDP